jgi:hypothetical protein
MIEKGIKIELITTAFWVCPQVSHDMLSMDGVRGGCFGSLYPNFRNFQLQFPHGNFSRNILYDHSLSIGTSLKTLTLTCPYKKHKESSKTTQTNISMLFFLQLLNREIVIISPTNCQTNELMFATFQRAKKNFKLV